MTNWFVPDRKESSKWIYIQKKYLHCSKAVSITGTTCFLIDSKGYIWLPTAKVSGRSNLENEEDKVQYRSGENGLGTFPISQIIEDKEGRIFLGTRGSGLFHYDEKNKRFIGYTTENSFIASDYCYELTLSTLDQLVITGDKGITFSIRIKTCSRSWNWGRPCLWQA